LKGDSEKVAVPDDPMCNCRASDASAAFQDRKTPWAARMEGGKGERDAAESERDFEGRDDDDDDDDGVAAAAESVCRSLSSEEFGATTKARERSTAAPVLTQAPSGVNTLWT
jgi:hypothetical protein